MGSISDPSETLERLERLGAKRLWVAYHNYAALTQAKVVPASRFADVASGGVSFAKANWDFTIDDHQLEHAAFGANTGDFRVVPDPATIVPIPYRPGVAQTFGWLIDELGAPWPGDPRALLSRAVEELQARGLTAKVAFEAEFLLARSRVDGAGRTLAGWEPSDRGRMFTVDEVEARWSWVASILDALDGMGVPTHQFASEYGRGQYELSLLPADPLAAVDQFLLARQVVRALSRDRDLVATFMPKPWTDAAGNGVHIHVSLWDADGREVIADAGSDVGLSAEGLSAVGGLLEHAPAQAALSAATPNSYKRLQPGSWAPAHVAWAFGNRAALVRVPGGGASRHLEYRMADASANPYLATIGLLAAVLDGLDRRLVPPPQTLVDVGHMSDAAAATIGCARLPTDLAAALDALERDPVILAALGPVVAEHYIAVKRSELAAYRSALADAREDPGRADVHVTDWERDTYLEHV